VALGSRLPPVGGAIRVCDDVIRASGIDWQVVAIGRSRAGQDHGRTGPYEAAKLRHELADFHQEPSGWAVVPPEAKANRSRRFPVELACMRTGERSGAGAGRARRPGCWTQATDFRGAGLGNHSLLFAITMADNYIQQRRTKPQSGQSSQRTHKDRFDDSCGATGSRARPPVACIASLLQASLVAAARWAGPSGIAALSSGRAGLPG
jgi:hypothetical protein